MDTLKNKDFIEKKYEIQMKDTLIKFKDLESNITKIFKKTQKFIINDGVPTMEFNYILINNNKFPMMTNKLLDYSEIVYYKIYIIEEDLLFIVEKNNNNEKTFFIKNMIK